MGAAAAGEAGICRACPSALRNHTPADGLKKQGEQEEPQGGGHVEGPHPAVGGQQSSGGGAAWKEAGGRGRRVGSLSFR